MKKAQKQRIVEVTWLDAAGGQKVDRTTLKNVNPKELLVVNKTYGILWKEDKYAILILQEDSCDEVDYTVIPKSWTIEIKDLGNNRS